MNSFASQKESCSHLNHFLTHQNSKCSGAEFYKCQMSSLYCAMVLSDEKYQAKRYYDPYFTKLLENLTANVIDLKHKTSMIRPIDQNARPFDLEPIFNREEVRPHSTGKDGSTTK